MLPVEVGLLLVEEVCVLLVEVVWVLLVEVVWLLLVGEPSDNLLSSTTTSPSKGQF